MTLYVPLPGLFRFERILNTNESLKGCLKQVEGSISRWNISEDINMEELKNILVENKLNYTLK